MAVLVDSDAGLPTRPVKPVDWRTEPDHPQRVRHGRDGIGRKGVVLTRRDGRSDERRHEYVRVMCHVASGRNLCLNLVMRNRCSRRVA